MQDIFLWVVENRFFLMGGLVALAALDYLYDLATGAKRSTRELLVNVSIFCVGQALHLTLIQEIPFQGLRHLAQFGLWTLPPSVGWFFVALVATDFLYYCWHRASHTIPLLWAEHSVHHSSNEFNFSTSIRLPWINPLVIWVFFAPLVLVGFSPEIVYLCMSIVIVGQFFVHNDHVPRLGWIEYVLTTPSNHRVHHGYDRDYADKNFGGIFVIWDRIFGTYAPETRHPTYRAATARRYGDPVSVNVGPFMDLARDVAKEKSVSRRLLRLFKQPEAERAMKRFVSPPAQEENRVQRDHVS